MNTCRRCNRDMVPRGTPTGNRSHAIVGPFGKVRQGPRRLCFTCYNQARSDGTVFEYPTLGYIRKEDFLEERTFLMEQGCTDQMICEKFGYKWDSYTRKLLRAGVRRDLD